MAELVKNFRSKLNLACADDKYRVALNYVVFKGGKAICTNGTMLVIQCLEVHGFEEHEIEEMEGGMIHCDVFKEIIRYKSVEVKDGHFECVKGEVTTKFAIEEEKEFPDYKNSLPSLHETGPLESVGVNLSLMKKAHDITMSYNKHVEARFHHETKAIIMRGTDLSWEQETILIMPVTID